MSESGKDKDGRRVPIGSRTVAGVGAVAILISAPIFRNGDWEGLSQLLTLAYQFGAIMLAGHYLLHLYEGYLTVGLARPTLYETALVLIWGFVAVLLGGIQDPKLPVLAVCWLVSFALLLALATAMETARKDLKKATGRRARRATDVIRESYVWLWLCNRLAQVDDEKVEDLRRKFSKPDTEDGKLSRTFWVTLCSTAAIGLVAAAGAVGSTVAPGETSPNTGDGEHQEDDQEYGREIQVPEGEDCGALYNPVNVPEPERGALILAWREVNGLEPGPMEALGYDIAGCPGPARRIPELPGSWYAPGYCDGDLRGVAVALEGMDHPVYLLEQAAELALPLIRQGLFLSAEDRFEVAGGDAYVIDSRRGSYVPIRDAVTAGPVEGSGGSNEDGCGEYADRDVVYGIAGPGLIEAWEAVAAITPGGVYPIPYGRTEQGQVRIALRSREVGIVAVARCNQALLACEAEIAGTNRRWSGGAEINREEVEALVEP